MRCCTQDFNWKIAAGILAIAAIAVFILLASGCAAVPTAQPAALAPHWQIAPIGSGTVFQIDTTTGHGYIVAPDGVIDVGTVDKPTLRAKERPSVDLQALQDSVRLNPND